MEDKIFLDTNVLVYCYSTTDVHKQEIARSLSNLDNVYISTQVLNETTNVLSRKYNITWIDLVDLITDFENNFSIQTLTSSEIKKACNIADKYKFSFFDSLIIASAIESGCNILYSEDMHNGQVIDDKIRISNPFL